MDFKHGVGLTTEYLLGGFKYLLGIFMVIEGIGTMFAPLSGGTLGFIYSSRFALVCFGILFASSGLMLLYGKIRKSKKWTGLGLMFIYLSFLFGAILQFVAYGGDPVEWVGNAIAALIVGLLWLRWKFKTYYINPKHFTRDIRKLS